MSQAKKLSPVQVAERWGHAITTGTLANWRAQRKGPPYQKLGVKVVYPLDSLEKYEAKHMHLVPTNDNQPIENDNE